MLTGRLWAGRPRSWPLKIGSPSVGVSKPASMRISVVLPQPEGAEQRKELALVDVELRLSIGGEVAEPLGDVLER
jgi:hypothetical protein